MTKQAFWPMFRASWEASFTAKNIRGAFAKASIFPHKLGIVLEKITRPKPELMPISCE
jgi:hypothetical protein